jgi:hypothetical protein
MKQSVKEKSIVQIATDLFGRNVNISFNQDKTFACFTVLKKPDMNNPVNALEFGVYSIKEQSLVYREQKYNASVEWFNKTNLVVKSRPGVKSLDTEQDKAMREYYINVNTLEITLKKPN